MEQDRLAHRARRLLPPPVRVARGLGWFSLAFGLAEVLMPRTIARACGMKDGAGLVRLYGLREIACGLGILRAKNAEPWLWARVAGDVMDASSLIAEADVADQHALRRGGIALAKVLAVTALDIHTARNWQPPRKRPGIDYPDYSGRVGMPKPPEQMRGLARTDFGTPRDMRTPELLRPWSDGAPPTAAASLSIGPVSADQEETAQLARGDFG